MSTLVTAPIIRNCLKRDKSHWYLILNKKNSFTKGWRKGPVLQQKDMIIHLLTLLNDYNALITLMKCSLLWILFEANNCW